MLALVDVNKRGVMIGLRHVANESDFISLLELAKQVRHHVREEKRTVSPIL
jgi:hypothetical protein